MTLFRNKYRAESHRLKGWNYANQGIYFITMVIEKRACILGSIVDGKMQLSDFGQIVDLEFYRSFELRKELVLHEFVVMPNHLHALVEIIAVDSDGGQDSPVDSDGRLNPSKRFGGPSELTEGPVRQPKSISSFVAGFKAATVKKIDDLIDEKGLKIPKYNRFNRLWLNNYHDHIVRNERAYWNIRNYIKNNPQKWEEENL